MPRDDGEHSTLHPLSFSSKFAPERHRRSVCFLATRGSTASSDLLCVRSARNKSRLTRRAGRIVAKNALILSLSMIAFNRSHLFHCVRFLSCANALRRLFLRLPRINDIKRYTRGEIKKKVLYACSRYYELMGFLSYFTFCFCFRYVSRNKLGAFARSNRSSTSREL